MKLTAELLPAVADFFNKQRPGGKWSTDRKQLQASFARNPDKMARTQVLVRDGGEIIGQVSSEPFDPTHWLLFELICDSGATSDERTASLALIGEALEHARSEGATYVETRIPAASLSDGYRATLATLGFYHFNDRVEFKSDVAALPDEQGTPFSWEVSTENTFSHAVQLLNEIAATDPLWDPNETAESFLAATLSDSVLTGGPSCVHIGKLAGERAAIVIVQINPVTGWSRITHMGMRAEFRGKGLGKWVHRHGFAMIREQQGTQYHGGTSLANTAMIALFHRHGCVEFKRFEEWKWRGDGGG